jgi:hypothetical protein
VTTDGTTSSTPPDPDDPTSKPIYKRWWFITGAVILGLIVLGSLVGEGGEASPVAAESTTTTSAAPTTPSSEAEHTTSTSHAATATTDALATTTTAAPTTTSTTTTPGPEPAFASGIQVVGEDVQPGIYETSLLGEGIFEGCYWERLSGFSGDFDELIANNNAVVHDVVEIMSSDAAFDSDCGPWYELTPLEPLLSSIPQGKWVVGVHIEAGTYQAEGGDGCYWERLSGVSGEFDDLIANDLPGGSAIVEISSSDYAFNSSGCGEWTLRG